MSDDKTDTPMLNALHEATGGPGLQYLPVPGEQEDTTPLSAEQEARVSALYHATEVLRTERGSTMASAYSKTPGKADDILCLAEYIISGELWFDEDDSLVKKVLKQ